MSFWAGMAIGVLISFVVSLLLDKPETVYTIKKLRAKKGGVVDVSQETGKKRLFKRKNK